MRSPISPHVDTAHTRTERTAPHRAGPCRVFPEPIPASNPYHGDYCIYAQYRLEDRIVHLDA